VKLEFLAAGLRMWVVVTAGLLIAFVCGYGARAFIAGWRAEESPNNAGAGLGPRIVDGEIERLRAKIELQNQTIDRLVKEIEENDSSPCMGHLR